ncbi:MAG: hypothetical protein MN733_12335 [Nitrososphaera sp.]|nr:hypothetical protein [Nitrososphaera sp.]
MRNVFNTVILVEPFPSRVASEGRSPVIVPLYASLKEVLDSPTLPP